MKYKARDLVNNKALFVQVVRQYLFVRFNYASLHLVPGLKLNWAAIWL